MPDPIYFAALTEDGRAAAFYTPAVHGEAIPIDARQLTLAQYETWVEDPAGYAWDPEALGGVGGPVAVDPPAPSLERLVALVKLEAGRRILRSFADWKQRNMTATGVALIEKGAANWTETDQATSDALKAAWAWIESVRAASDGLETVLASYDDDARRAFDPADDSHWPAAFGS